MIIVAVNLCGWLFKSFFPDPLSTRGFDPLSTRGSRQNKTLTNKIRVETPAGEKNDSHNGCLP